MGRPGKLLSLRKLRLELDSLASKVEDEDEDDEAISLEAFGRFVRQAGNLMARGGFSEAYEESLVVAKHDRNLPAYGPMVHKTKAMKFIAVCIRAVRDNERSDRSIGEWNDQNNKPESLGLKPTTRIARPRQGYPRYLPPKHLDAYKQYKEAEDAKGRRITDHEAYVWVMGKYDQLPTFETWKRYVRGGRKANNDRKNNSRYGRPLGRSIVRAKDIFEARNAD